MAPDKPEQYCVTEYKGAVHGDSSGTHYSFQVFQTVVSTIRFDDCSFPILLPSPGMSPKYSFCTLSLTHYLPLGGLSDPRTTVQN